MGDRNVGPKLVTCLLSEQFPHWADLPLEHVKLSGWDNTTSRLGEQLLVRLPNEDAFVEQIKKEQHWLPVIAKLVPVSIPIPVGFGRPGCGFPRPWSIYGWLDGQTIGPADTLDLNSLAFDLAEFLLALQQVPIADGPIPGEHNYHRGGPLAIFDDQVRATFGSLRGRIDTNGAIAVWDAAVTATWDGPAVWIHGDMTGSNVLIRAGRLRGVIDFGCSAIGDPACDLGIAWTLFEGSDRDEFVRQIGVDENTWARARGWVLWKAVKGLAAHSEGHPRNNGIRLGWRWPSTEVLSQLIETNSRG